MSVSLGGVSVCVNGATANRAPSRAASVKTCLVFINRPASKTPKRSMKNIGRMIAASRPAVPLSEMFPLRLASILIALPRKMWGSAEPRLSVRLYLSSEAALDLGKDDIDLVSNALTKAHNHDCN